MTSPAGFAQQVYQLPSSAFDEPALVNPGQEPGELQAEEAGGLPLHGTPRLMAALADLKAAREDYALADSMCGGTVGDALLNRRVAELMERAGVNEIEDLQYARVPVDTMISKLGIRAVTVAPTDLDPGQKPTPEQESLVEQAQKVLSQIRRHNQLDIEEVELFHRACRYGEAYMEVWPSGAIATVVGDDDEPEMALNIDGIDIFVCSPVNVRAFYDAEQPLLLTHVLKAWEWYEDEGPEAKARYRATIFDYDGIERWICEPDGSPDRAEDWKPFVDDVSDEWPLPYPEGMVDDGGEPAIPFFHFRNERPYGVPEHRAAYGPQRLINKLVSAHAVSIDYQAFPQRYALLDPKADDALLNLVDPDNPEDDDDDPEGGGFSQLRADPAALWKLRAQSVGQFSPADPAVFLTPLDRYIRSIAELCGIPLDRFTGYSTPPSGQSRRIGNEVLYDKAGLRRRRYQGTLADAYEFALRLMGFGELQVLIKWEPMDVAVGPEDWAVISQKIANGVPSQQALVEAGYAEDEVKQWLLDQGGQDLIRRVALLNQIGTAVQALAAGVGVGIISREQTADLFARVLGEIGEDIPSLEQPVTVQPPPIPPQMPGAGPAKDEEGGTAPAMPQMPPMPPPIQVGQGGAPRPPKP
jgi:hypothetical protein